MRSILEQQTVSVNDLLRQRKVEYDREYYQRNKDKLSAQKREYRQRNKDKLSAQQREYYQRNKDKLSAQKREYRQRNKGVTQRELEFQRLRKIARQWDQEKKLGIRNEMTNRSVKVIGV
ncbi:MAG: hypothetical protein ACYCQJ_12820 [Nitrososphaerales archaeon]